MSSEVTNYMLDNRARVRIFLFVTLPKSWGPPALLSSRYRRTSPGIYWNVNLITDSYLMQMSRMRGALRVWCLGTWTTSNNGYLKAKPPTTLCTELQCEW